jgi:hypothetical protein
MPVWYHTQPYRATQKAKKVWHSLARYLQRVRALPFKVKEDGQTPRGGVMHKNLGSNWHINFF